MVITSEKLVGYFDGASRGNPGKSGAGAVLYDYNGVERWRCAEYLGIGTNNEAEYNAVIRLIKAANSIGADELKVCGDSNLVVNQMSGAWKIKEPRLRVLASQAKKEAGSMKITYVWVPREKNNVADSLSNEAIDKHEFENL